MTMQTLAPSAPVVNHLRPFRTQLSPSSAALVSSISGFAPLLPGSVMPKQLRISPATSGLSQRFFCAGRAEFMQQLDIAGIRRIAAEHVVRERAASERLRDQPMRDQVETEAAMFVRIDRPPETELLDLRALPAQHRQQGAETGLQERGFERNQFAINVFANPVDD